MLFQGQTVASAIIDATKLRIQENELTPGLGVIIVGDDAPSHLYVSIKEKRAEVLGIHFVKKVFPADVEQGIIKDAIEEMNNDDRIHGIIVQIPLPGHLDTESIINTIKPEKDTDGFHSVTIEKFLAGDTERLPVFPRAMLELVEGIKILNKQFLEFTSKKNALALVNSDLMGRVLIKALKDSGYEAQYVFGSEKEKIENLLPTQTVILTAVGAPSTLSVMNAKPGAIIIDGGISYDEQGRVIGDVTRDDGVYREDIFVTPVPGGVGPVTVAVLLARVTEAALRTEKISKKTFDPK